MKLPAIAILLACLMGGSGGLMPCGAHDHDGDDKSLLALFPGERDVALEATGLPSRQKHNLTAHIAELREKTGIYALGVAADSPLPAGLKLAIAGDALDAEPTVSDDGLTTWWLLSASQLRDGDNAITLAADADFAPSEVLLIALENSGEEAHFGRLVSRATQKVQPPTHAQQDLMDVLHMDISFTLNMASRNVPAAAVELTAKAVAPGLTQCVLDFNNNGGAYVVGTVTAQPSGQVLTTSYSSNRLFINLPAEVPVGDTFTVRVPLSGTPPVVSGKGYIRTTHSSVPIIYTHCQPYNGRDWYPSKDVPEDKFTLETHITAPDTVYNGYQLYATSNGSLQSIVPGTGTNTFNWKEDYPIASYLVVFNCTNYRAATGTYTSRDGLKTMPVTHYLYPEIYDAESVELPRTIEVMNFYADTFGEYPFLNEKYATATWTITFGVEHQTITSMPSGNLSTPYHRRNIHEMSHMWFGDAITCRTYDELWLNEGWATYCEALTYEHINGRQAYYDTVNSWSPTDTQPVVSSSADNFDNGVVYKKGGFILHMLRHQIGDTAFFAGTRAYMADPALRYGTATTDLFKAHMEAASGKDLDQFFTQWCYRASRPNFQWYWTQNGDNLSVYLNQTQADSPYFTPVDLRLTFSDSTTSDITVETTQRTQTFTLPMGGKTVSSVTFDPLNFLHETNTRLTSLPGPAVPTLLTVIGNGAAGTATLTWVDQSAAANMQGFRLYRYSDSLTDTLASATLVANETVLGPTATSYTVTGLAAGETAYFGLTAVGPSETDRSDMYGVRLATAGESPLLVVDANDRWVTQTSLNPSLRNHLFASIHGKSISAAGRAFDTVANETLGSVTLANYPLVDWVMGDESTAQETFSTAEQTAISAYLVGGGALLATGNEVTWDLDNRGSTADKAFCHDYLRATYSTDDSGNYTLVGSGGASPFGTQPYAYGSGDALYQPASPDTLTATGSMAVLNYGSGTIAGVFYRGVFGTGTATGAVMTFGFGFETLSSQANRDDVMARALQALLPPPTANIGDGFVIR